MFRIGLQELLMLFLVFFLILVIVSLWFGGRIRSWITRVSERSVFRRASRLQYNFAQTGQLAVGLRQLHVFAFPRALAVAGVFSVLQFASVMGINTLGGTDTLSVTARISYFGFIVVVVLSDVCSTICLLR